MIDAWMQHSIDRYFGDPMFYSLRRWTKSDLEAVPTIADTVAALDAAGVSTALCGGAGLQGDSHLAVARSLPPTDRRFYPGYVACCEMGVPFCTQIGHTGPLMPSEVGRPIYLDQVALELPELTVVGGHIGYPWTDEAIAVGTKHRDVYIDTSAYTVDRYPPQLVDYLKHHGSQKVLFGSNYPMITPAKALAGLDSLGLDETTRSYFLEDHARRVYGL